MKLSFIFAGGEDQHLDIITWGSSSADIQTCGNMDNIKTICHFLSVSIEIVSLVKMKLRGKKQSNMDAVDKHTKTGISVWLLLL